MTLRLASHGSTVAERRDRRDHVAVAASLRPFFQPRSVAVIGASARRGTIGGELFRNVLEADFAGAVYPVNRGGEPVGGVAGYTSCAELPTTVDLAVICVPGASVLDAAREALETGVRALCVISAGFAETGSDGEARQDELLALVRAHGARLVGPNCLGIASSAVRLNATFARRALPAGRVAFSSQSGALGLALLEEADGRGLGLSSFLSIGNKADVSSNDLLEYWEEDEATDLILLYLESFGNPRKFARVAGRVARSKPILAMRSGTSRAGARAASSHTAALASSDAAVDALFWQAGVLRLRTLEELLDAAVLFSTQPLPRGDRVAVLTNAGGLGILCADACEVAGLKLPPLADETVRALQQVIPAEASVSNPVDILGSATAATYEATLPLLIRDPGIDAVICLFVPPVVATAADVAASDRPRLGERRQAGAPGRDERRRHTGGRVRVSRVRCPRARPRRTPRGLATPPRRRAAEARPHRPRRCNCADRGRARVERRCLARARSRSGAARRIRSAARRGAVRGNAGRRARLRRPRSATRSSSRRPRPARTRPSRAVCISTCATPRASRARVPRSPGR